MTSATLTDSNFWLDYWKNFQVAPNPPEFFFSDLSEHFPPAGSRFLEIGGFPGTFSAYFRKKHGYEVALLDIITFPEPIAQTERANGLASGTIRCIEANLLSFVPDEQFDFVFSAGFVEHFADTRMVIGKHLDLLREGGFLFISVPNFRGINGLVQKGLDRKNYEAHNLESMDLSYLRRICAKLDLVDCSIFYHGTPRLWLDHPDTVHPLARKIVSMTSGLMARTSLNNRLFSPYVVIMGKKLSSAV